MKIPELLAPAGGMKQLLSAVRFGANAVYLGLNRFGMRAHAANFDHNELPRAIEICKDRNVRVYLTLNIFAFDEDIKPMIESARFAIRAGVDALIMSDIGAIDAVKQAIPDAEIHLSTQMSTMNTEAALFFHHYGIKRIVLARELSLDHIRVMRAHLPASCELEAFVHGSVCMAYSGRCALSQYLTGRSANRGDCAQACRWSYALEEERREGVFIPVEQTKAGMKILSAGDLNMIRYLPALCEAGLDALKIEGRMKNEYYVATVAGAYRKGLYALKKGIWNKQLAMNLEDELNTVSHRPYDTGFYFGQPQYPGGRDRLTQTKELAARVVGHRNNMTLIQVKRKITRGEVLDLLTPKGIYSFTLGTITLEDGTSTDLCAIPDLIVSIELPVQAEEGDLLRGENLNHHDNID